MWVPPAVFYVAFFNSQETGQVECFNDAPRFSATFFFDGCIYVPGN